MTGRAIFLTHADVVVDPDVPVPDWPLNPTGRERHAVFASDPVLQNAKAIFSSDERKAKDAAKITASALGLDVQVFSDLGENDRSATGYLPEADFWPVVDAFFGEPERLVRGWERAADAQARIVAVTRKICATDTEGDPLIVSHGGVATLLRCHLLGQPISKDCGQPHPKGGCWFAFDRDMTNAPTDWTAI